MTDDVPGKEEEAPSENMTERTSKAPSPSTEKPDYTRLRLYITLASLPIAAAFVVYLFLSWGDIQACSQVQKEIVSGDFLKACGIVAERMGVDRGLGYTPDFVLPE
jgi:hypothetical protein